jgi:hypothetical protein
MRVSVKAAGCAAGSAAGCAMATPGISLGHSLMP